MFHGVPIARNERKVVKYRQTILVAIIQNKILWQLTEDNF